MPAHRRGPWSQAEDQCLMMLVMQQGASNWVRISQLIQTRSPKQCRERYHQNLKPNLNHTPITAEEGRRIEELVGTMGKRWAEIARRLPGRSDNAVKNWWNGGQNRRRRAGGRTREDGSLEQNQSFPLQTQHPGRTDAFLLPPPLSMSNTYDRSHGVDIPTAFPQPAMYAQVKRPEPLDLRVAPAPHSLYSSHYYGYPTPLPSPSGHPIVSGEMPSMSSESSYNMASHTAMSLPPLIGDRVERRNSQVAWLPSHTTGFVGSDGHFGAIAARAEATQRPPFREPQWNPRTESPMQRLPYHRQELHSYSQRPLPAYESLQVNIPPPAPKILASQATSPSSASRVGISSMLNQHEDYSSMKRSSAGTSSHPNSPHSSSSHTASPPRSSKMDITSLI